MKKNLHAIGLLLFGLSTVGAIADDHGNSRATSTTIPAGQLAINGRLDTTTDEDWFRFTVTRRSLVLIYTVNPDPAFQTTDTYGKLYDAGGSYLGYSNDVSGAAENFQISAQLSAGTYYLRVSDDDRDDVGNYRLYVHTSDNASSASDARTSGTITYEGESTFYRFTLGKRQKVFLYTVNPNPSTVTTDTFGKLYDSEGQYLGYSNDVSGAGENFFIEAILNPGTYYLQISDDDQDNVGSYELRITNQENSAKVDGGTYPASLDYVGDIDFYEFRVTTTGMVTIQTIGSTDTFGVLYDNQGAYLGYSNDDSGAGKNFKIAANLGAGTYYLEVSDDDLDARGSYSLHLDLPGRGGSIPQAVWDDYYARANIYYQYFAGQGDTNTGLPYWYYFRAFGDQAYYQAFGYYGYGQFKFHEGLAYYYYTYYQNSAPNWAGYYLYLHLGYAYYDYFNAVGDPASANSLYSTYYAFALSVL